MNPAQIDLLLMLFVLLIVLGVLYLWDTRRKPNRYVYPPYRPRYDEQLADLDRMIDRAKEINSQLQAVIAESDSTLAAHNRTATRH